MDNERTLVHPFLLLFPLLVVVAKQAQDLVRLLCHFIAEHAQVDIVRLAVPGLYSWTFGQTELCKLMVLLSGVVREMAFLVHHLVDLVLQGQ